MSKKQTTKNTDGAVTAKLGPFIEELRKAAKLSELSPASFMRIVLIDAAKRVNAGEIRIAVSDPEIVFAKPQTTLTA